MRPRPAQPVLLSSCVINLLARNLERLPASCPNNQLPIAELHYIFVSKVDEAFLSPHLCLLPYLRTLSDVQVRPDCFTSCQLWMMLPEHYSRSSVENVLK